MVELGAERWTQTIFVISSRMEKSMHHNLESRNQMYEWNHTDEKLDEYYECLIDCDVGHSSSGCRRICKEILM